MQLAIDSVERIIFKIGVPQPHVPPTWPDSRRGQKARR